MPRPLVVGEDSGVPKRGVAALGLGEGRSGPVGEGARVLRRRQANAPGGRSVVVKVRVTERDAAELTRLAAGEGVTVPRLLVEAALAGGGGTASERRELSVELFKLVRLLGSISNNVNQVARKVNATGDVVGVEPELRAVLGATGRLYERADALLDALSVTR